MQHLDDGTNVDAGCQVRNPVSSYTSGDLAAREWEGFFQDYPQVLGLSADLPDPESFFTSNDVGKPILCTRAEDGVFRAFLNVCRHRATNVEAAPRGPTNPPSWASSTAPGCCSGRPPGSWAPWPGAPPGRRAALRTAAPPWSQRWRRTPPAGPGTPGPCVPGGKAGPSSTRQSRGRARPTSCPRTSGGSAVG